MNLMWRDVISLFHTIFLYVYNKMCIKYVLPVSISGEWWTLNNFFKKFTVRSGSLLWLEYWHHWQDFRTRSTALRPSICPYLPVLTDSLLLYIYMLNKNICCTICLIFIGRYGITLIVIVYIQTLET